MNEIGALDDLVAQSLLASLENKELYRQFILEMVREFRLGHLCYEPSLPVSLPSSICCEASEIFPLAPIVKQGKRYYFQKNWVLENTLIQETKRLRGLNPPEPFNKIQFFKELEALQHQKKLFPEQAQVISSAFSSSFSVICGGPGTGKTYTAGHLVRLFVNSLDKSLDRPYRILLAAPTGKAALHLKSSILSQGHLSESAICESSTIHRMLHLQPGENKLFSGRRIDADLIIVDEASMIDASLLAHLMQSVGGGSRLILMGDPNQLPPIQSGMIFPELSRLFGVFLTQCARTDDDHLHRTAEAILQGDERTFFELVDLEEDWDHLLIESLWKFSQPITSWERPDPIKTFAHYNRFRILDALRQGPYGTTALNDQIFKKVVQECKWGQWWAVPIMSTKNDSKKDLYNGTAGILIGQKKGGTILSFAYFPSVGEIPFSQIPPHEIAFCISIHKSQGSEFDEVMALFPEGSEHFGREALYTAATRAKKKWSAIGSREVLKKLLIQVSLRRSGFTDSFPCHKLI